MTEQKPVAWFYHSPLIGEVMTKTDPIGRYAVTNIRPLYEHPAPAQPATDPAVEAALKEATALAMVLWQKHYAETAPNWKPLLDLPGVLSQIDNMTAGLSRTPEQPATDPAVEAARRKALRLVLVSLSKLPTMCDTAPIMTRIGVMRDLVGQPRKAPERRIPGYDEEPKEPTASGEQRLPGAVGYDANGPVPVWRSQVFESQLPEKGPEQPTPARLSVDMLASVIANNGATRVDPTGKWVVNLAKAVHAAVYGKDVE